VVTEEAAKHPDKPVEVWATDEHRIDRIIVLGLDNAGWHTAPNLAVPDGLRLVYLPRYSPERQPAEPLWPILDEPLANRSFETLTDLERAVTERCRVLNGDQLKPGTTFHWWPKPLVPT
jgi:transposase